MVIYKFTFIGVCSIDETKRSGCKMKDEKMDDEKWKLGPKEDWKESRKKEGRKSKKKKERKEKQIKWIGKKTADRVKWKQVT